MVSRNGELTHVEITNPVLWSGFMKGVFMRSFFVLEMDDLSTFVGFLN